MILQCYSSISPFPCSSSFSSSTHPVFLIACYLMVLVLCSSIEEAPTTSAAGGATVLGDHCIVPSCDNDRYEQKHLKRGGGRLNFFSLCSCLLIGRSTSTRRRDNKISGGQQSEEGNCSSKQDSNVSTTARIKDKRIATAAGKKKQARRRKPQKDTSLLLSSCNQDTLISDKIPSDLEQGKRSTVLRDSLTSIFHWRVLEKG